jgi:hypothetical protein
MCNAPPPPTTYVQSLHLLLSTAPSPTAVYMYISKI